MNKTKDVRKILISTLEILSESLWIQRCEPRFIDSTLTLEHYLKKLDDNGIKEARKRFIDEHCFGWVALLGDENYLNELRKAAKVQSFSSDEEIRTAAEITALARQFLQWSDHICDYADLHSRQRSQKTSRMPEEKIFSQAIALLVPAYEAVSNRLAVAILAKSNTQPTAENFYTYRDAILNTSQTLLEESGAYDKAIAFLETRCLERLREGRAISPDDFPGMAQDIIKFLNPTGRSPARKPRNAPAQ